MTCDIALLHLNHSTLYELIPSVSDNEVEHVRMNLVHIDTNYFKRYRKNINDRYATYLLPQPQKTEV